MPWLLRIIGRPNSAHFDGTLVLGRSRPQHQDPTSVARSNSKFRRDSIILSGPSCDLLADIVKFDDAVIGVRAMAVADKSVAIGRYRDAACAPEECVLCFLVLRYRAPVVA